MNENQAKVRASLLDAVLWFVGSVAGLAGVQRIALIGSLLRERPSPKDVDLVVYVADDADLAPLAAAARRLKGRLQGQNRGADVFLADDQRRYLGRTCSWKICQPGVRASCDAFNCGRRRYLHDDLATIRLDDSVIAVPLLELWPVVVQRGPMPTDVKELVSRLQQPHNSAFGAQTDDSRVAGASLVVHRYGRIDRRPASTRSGTRRRIMHLGALGLAFVLFAAPFAAEAQPAGKVPRIGLLQIGSPVDASATFPAEIFRQALRDLGYVEGQSIVIEYRSAEGRLDRLPALAADLVRVKVDVIVTGGVAAVRAAKQATTIVPIVMSATTDPVGAGLVASLARPGGNVTGSATQLSELGAKRLELLKEAVPRASRVAVLYDPTTSPSVLREIEDAADRLKVRLNVLEVQAPADLEGAFREIRKSHATALVVLASPFFLFLRDRIASLAMEHHVPASVPHRTYVEAGGLMSYGPNLRDLQRRAAVFVDKILKGAKPGDLPVEQADTFELVINRKTAKVLGLTIPPSLLRRADHVIE